MWLAALKMFVEMAKMLNYDEDADRFMKILEKAKKNFEAKLWNGIILSHILHFRSPGFWRWGYGLMKS